MKNLLLNILSAKYFFLAMLMGLGLTAFSFAEVVFYSTQMRPVEEAKKIREKVLANFSGNVDFVPDETPIWITKIQAENKTGKVTVSLLGGLHGDFSPVASALDNVDDVLGKISGNNIVDTFVKTGKLGGNSQKYIPWAQATYIMAAHKDALAYLPKGADVNALSYNQLAQWGQNMEEALGERKIGFPAGPKGLMHRFFQGYLYPSFTDGVVRTFKSKNAENMWAKFRRFWHQSVSPRSTSFNNMSEHLLSGEVLVAFDHTARLIPAFNERPNDFVAFPAPSAQYGRGFMAVIVGLAIPKGAPERTEASDLIRYLTSKEAQLTVLEEIGFFPIIDIELPSNLPKGTQLAGDAVSLQSSSSDALPALLPSGLGTKGGEFSKVYKDTFETIVFRNANISKVLEAQAKKLTAIMQESGASCWAPDAPSKGPCPVK